MIRPTRTDVTPIQACKRPWVAGLLAVGLALSACSTSGGQGSDGADEGPDGTATSAPSTTATPTSDLDTATAAAAAQAAIDLGDTLGDCPLGTPGELVDAIGDSDLVAPELADSTDDGQVFSGGEVDITYCDLFTSGGEDTQVTELRIDVAPGSDIDIDTYLNEEFVDPEDVSVTDVDGFDGGDASAACWDDDQTCGAFWQGADLFVAVVPMTDDGTLTTEDATTLAEALVPVVVTNLAES